MKVAHPRILIDPAIRFGKPTMKGTRICVHDILGWLSGGATPESIAVDYNVTAQDVRDACAFAADVLTYKPIEAEYARRMGDQPTGDPFLDGDDEDEEAGEAVRIAAE